MLVIPIGDGTRFILGPPRSRDPSIKPLSSDKLKSMGTGRRAYDLLRGYVNQEWERIRNVDETPEEREVREALAGTSVQVERTTVVEQTFTTIDPQDWARKVLGVHAGADFAEIRKAFERLNSRSDPSKFPIGSAEARQSSEIQGRVQQAYAILSDSIDPTEKRFKSLEID